MSTAIAQIKTATAAAIQRLGGLEAAATVCRASFQTLGGYQNRNRPDLIIPLDVALELDAACQEPVILSALARMQGFTLTAPERAEKPQIDTAMAQIAGGAGALLATFVEAKADDHLDAGEKVRLREHLDAIEAGLSDARAGLAERPALKAVG